MGKHNVLFTNENRHDILALRAYFLYSRDRYNLRTIADKMNATPAVVMSLISEGAKIHNRVVELHRRKQH